MQGSMRCPRGKLVPKMCKETPPKCNAFRSEVVDYCRVVNAQNKMTMETAKEHNWEQEKDMIKDLYPTINDEDLKFRPGKERAMLARVAAKVRISDEAVNAILREEERGINLPKS